ncbi:MULTISPECIES: SDR family NAD(P)-dependent oxidoreductase [unclassified Burkholderia]|uniref:SDR family NAD(P)-dependent oxidoreductase n=1 Tax=unclassified Burkholderia TaxID=2613784 RepID=UPI00214FE50E|nr:MULTISPECIES: SDR family oxidoreductase [unclassified Burkholderia]MCR4471883.1 SDR family oxidoreductase [Burkholderia sp. SCN-KJ]
MVDRLKNKVAIVFGAGGPPNEWSNGKATAVAYAREGAAVICVDRIAEAAEDAARVIQAEGHDAIAVVADVTQTDDINRAVQTAIQHFGRLDILHNNVGVAPAGGPLELDDAAFQRTMDINVGSIHRTVRAVLPYFLEQQSGAIVNISSLSAIRWSGYSYFAYYASKAAVNQATVAIALQYAAQGIRANVIMPGVIDTPLVYKQISAQYSSIEEMVAARSNAVPMKKPGSPWDIANAAVFLASDEARFITGVCLPVDGGHSCVLPGLV